MSKWWRKMILWEVKEHVTVLGDAVYTVPLIRSKTFLTLEDAEAAMLAQGWQKVEDSDE